MGDLDLYQRNDALPHSYTLKRDEPTYVAIVTGPSVAYCYSWDSPQSPSADEPHAPGTRAAVAL